MELRGAYYRFYSLGFRVVQEAQEDGERKPSAATAPSGLLLNP